MSGNLETQLDMPYVRQPETRALAVRGLIRRDASDLLEMLGLVDDPLVLPRRGAAGEAEID